MATGTRGADASTQPTEVRPRSGATGSGIRGAPAGGAAAAAPLDQAYVDEVAARLAVHLGPIAKLVARKAALKATSRDEFVRLVADSVGTQERAAFLHEVRAAGR